MGRVAIIGDVGGHARCLRHTLDNLGADIAEHHLAEDLTVIQVGDIIGGTPDDFPLLRAVVDWQQHNPGRWIQLIGNWEAKHLGGHNFGTRAKARRHDLPAAGQQLLRALYATGRLAWAAVITTAAGNPVLTTHAGVTADWWHRHTGGDPDPLRVAQRLQHLGNSASPAVHVAGELLDDRRSRHVGPLWASCWELYRSWLNEPAVPFRQCTATAVPIDGQPAPAILANGGARTRSSAATSLRISIGGTSSSPTTNRESSAWTLGFGHARDPATSSP